jgi:nicotinate-nucleotide pyrophosphorylase (carboxylating)
VSLPNLPPARTWEPLLEAALGEDLGTGDVSSSLIFSADDRARARLESRQELVVCGLEVAVAVFERVEPRLRLERSCADGDALPAYTPLLHVEGPVLGMLAAERTALNFLGRLCGVATLTRRYVETVSATRAEIVDTRKTLPGWRSLDKYATAVGGARNHRMGLYDGILLKDNHLAAAGGVEAAVKRALTAAPPGLRVQVEVQSLAEAETACDAGADFLLLDNLKPDAIASIVERCGSRAQLEASGGITLESVQTYASTGVHRISIGALTHSAPNADLSLEIEATPGGASQ